MAYSGGDIADTVYWIGKDGKYKYLVAQINKGQYYSQTRL